MSNIVKPQIGQTNLNNIDFIKNNSIPLVPDFMLQNNGVPYIFLKDFSFINTTTDGSIGSNMVNYKKDQVVYPFPSSPNAKFRVNPAFKKAIDEGVLVKQNIVTQVNKADNISEKYRVNKDTEIYRINPNKKPQGIEVVGTDIIGNLKKGEIITVVRKGFGGKGVAPTPFLYLTDDTYIYGYNADLLSADEISKIENNKNLTTIVLLILVGFLTYKLVKK